MQQDIVLEEYEQFDDYLEMVVQFGVSCLFTNETLCHFCTPHSAAYDIVKDV